MAVEPLTKDTRTTIGVAIGCSVAVLSGALWIVNGFNKQATDDASRAAALSARIDELTFEVRSLQSSVSDRWTKTDHASWALKLARMNAQLNLKVPEEQ